MLRDVIPYDAYLRTTKTPTALASFIHFIERRLGGRFYFDVTESPLVRPEIIDLINRAERMRGAGVVRSYHDREALPDEPQRIEWRVEYKEGEPSAGGSAFTDHRLALSAALAEALERYIWYECNDHFRDERIAGIEEMRQIGSILDPNDFAGFSAKQRSTHRALNLTDGSFRWVRGASLLDDAPIYVPAQAISGSTYVHGRVRNGSEPKILHPISTGLATWQDAEGAKLRGLLEVIERDAYMITWLNQLTPRKFDIDALCKESELFAHIIESCRRYRLTPHVLRLVTDAPTYVVCVVLEDVQAPRFVFGMSAGADPAQAAEGAFLEALRGRYGARIFLAEDRPLIQRQEVAHHDRLLYWSQDGRGERLSFIVTGEVDAAREEWHGEDDVAHFSRLRTWLASREYAGASVSLTPAKANVTDWHVEMVVVPQMQPMGFSERLPYESGERLTSVPRACGFTPRAIPFTEEPHPFV